jgi:hypothetical protein
MKAIMEGTWDELAAHADELRRYPKLTLILPEEAPAPAPNRRMLDILDELGERQKDRPHTSAADTDRLIREARSGAMYDLDPRTD